MNTEPPVIAPPQDPIAAPPAHGLRLPRLITVVAVVAATGVFSSAMLWQKLSAIQEQLARQSADAGTNATEARTTARQAQELAMETAAKLAVAEMRLSEVSLQRTQLEELMQSLSRSRDENLVVDIDSAVRLAQQQAQLAGSVEPLLAALKSAELRVNRAAQPRLTPLQRAIARDIARIKATAVADTPALLIKLDELVLLTDELSLANAVTPAKAKEVLQRKSQESVVDWSGRLMDAVQQELRNLVRVSKIEDPEAAMLSPEQSFFLRENVKLKVLNARLGLLSRQNDSARSDLASAGAILGKYFDNSSRKTQTAINLLQQIQGQMKSLELPRVEDTLAALSTAAAGR